MSSEIESRAWILTRCDKCSGELCSSSTCVGTDISEENYFSRYHSGLNYDIWKSSSLLGVSDVPEDGGSLREVVSIFKNAYTVSLSGGQGFSIIIVRKSGRCKCRQIKTLYNSRCHMSITCSNTWQKKLFWLWGLFWKYVIVFV